MGKENKGFRPVLERPVFPKRAVVTAGMPYGNKELHFGHVGGMFVHADTFARFLRDRIGEENVIFIRTCIPYFSNPLLVGCGLPTDGILYLLNMTGRSQNMRFSSSLVPSQGEAQQQGIQ